MPQLSISDSTKNLAITTGLPILASDVPVEAFVELLNGLKAAIPGIKALSYQQSPSGDWLYRFDNGTRIWKQKVHPGATLDAYTMTFDVSDFWAMSEFMANRPVRDAVFTFQIQYQMTKLTVAFL